MSKKNNNQVSIPVIKQGKDICRLIFQPAEGGTFDIKLEFLGNPYQVCTYRLFALQPIVWNVDDPQHVNMSYHRGANEKPITIHLKDTTKQGRDQYRSLPAVRIQPPNTNQMFPIPLFKFEIPDSVVKNAPDYKRKTYHHVLDAGMANVLEIYMSGDNFSMDTYIDEKYATLLLPQMTLSMEYFATNTVVSDYEKSTHFMPKKPEVRFMSMEGMPGLKLFVNFYSVPEIDEMWNQLHITFIENELAEDILFCTKVSYPKVNLNPGEYDNIWLGASTIDQLKPPAGPLEKLPVMCNTTVLRTLADDKLSSIEKQKIENRASAARKRLYRELCMFQKNLEIQKKVYDQKAREFMDALDLLQTSVRQKAAKTGGGNISLTAVETWLLYDNDLKAEAIHILFARYLGLEQYKLLRTMIYKKNTKFFHVWLEIDDMLSIDLLRGSLNPFFEKKENQEPPILVFRSRLYFKDDNWDGIKIQLNKKGFCCDGPQFSYFDAEKVSRVFERNNGILEKVYQVLTFMLEQKNENDNLKEVSLNAEEIKVYQQRKLTVQRLQEEQTEAALWEAVIAFQNYPFRTVSGLPFSYVIKTGKDGNYNKELLIDRRKESKTLAWSSVVLAFRHAVELQGEIIERPKALGDIRGVSYIYPMLYRFALIEVPETAARKMLAQI